MRRAVLIVALIMSLGSCGQTSEPVAGPSLAPEAHYAEIEYRLAALERRIGDIDTGAMISVTGDTGYAALQTSHGPLFFMLDEARVRGDGQAISMRVGNPSSAALSGLKFKVAWGPSFGATRPDDAPELAPIDQRTRDIQIAEQLEPGSWTIVRFNIGPVRSEDFGTLFIRDVSLDQVALRNPS